VKSALLVVAATAGCYVGGGPRVSYTVRGPDRGKIHIGAEAETTAYLVRLSTGLEIGLRSPARTYGFVTAGLLVPGSILHSEELTPASRYSFTGGIAWGGAFDFVDSDHHAKLTSAWVGATRLLDDSVYVDGRSTGCFQLREAIVVDAGLRFRGASLDVFIAPSYREQLADACPRFKQ
jgi:hypothetical protein